MAKDIAGPVTDSAIDEVPLDEAFLDLPDDGNPPIIDARETFRITVIAAVLFIAAVYIFVL